MKKLSGVVFVSIMLIGINGDIFAELGKNKSAVGAIFDENYLAQFFPDSGSPFKRMRYKETSQRRSEQKSELPDLNYKKLIIELQNLKSVANLEAFRLVPNIDVLINWHLGEKIVAHLAALEEPEAQEDRLTQQLAKELSLEKESLFQIIRFYRLYRNVSEISTVLNWSHYLELIGVEDDTRRKEYQKKAIAEGWSIDRLKQEIRGLP